MLDANNDLFNKKALNRWIELRSNVLEKSKLKEHFSELYNFLLSNGNYERESLKWGQGSVDLSNLEYTYEWLDNWLNFLDNFFNPTTYNPDDFTIDSSDNFITTWTVMEADKNITFPGSNNSTIIGNYTIDWGDGHSEPATGNISHTYANAGTYRVTVSNGITRFDLWSMILPIDKNSNPFSSGELPNGPIWP